MITEIDRQTALVLIDLQKGIVKIETVPPVPEILANAARLVDAFHRHGLPVVVVNVNPMGAKWTKARVEFPTGARSAVGFTDIVPEIITHPDDVFITKHTWNAFFETNLQSELQKRQVTGIVLAGVATSIGVEGTARAAIELGYNISFATDAMTDRNPEAHQHSIKNIFPRIGELGSTDEIIGKLSSGK